MAPRMVVVAAGPVEHDEIVALVDKAFGCSPCPAPIDTIRQIAPAHPSMHTYLLTYMSACMHTHVQYQGDAHDAVGPRGCGSAGGIFHGIRHPRA